MLMNITYIHGCIILLYVLYMSMYIIDSMNTDDVRVLASYSTHIVHIISLSFYICIHLMNFSYTIDDAMSSYQNTIIFLLSHHIDFDFTYYESPGHHPTSMEGAFCLQQSMHSRNHCARHLPIQFPSPNPSSARD